MRSGDAGGCSRGPAAPAPGGRSGRARGARRPLRRVAAGSERAPTSGRQSVPPHGRLSLRGSAARDPGSPALGARSCRARCPSVRPCWGGSARPCASVGPASEAGSLWPPSAPASLALRLRARRFPRTGEASAGKEPADAECALPASPPPRLPPSLSPLSLSSPLSLPLSVSLSPLSLCLKLSNCRTCPWLCHCQSHSEQPASVRPSVPRPLPPRLRRLPVRPARLCPPTRLAPPRGAVPGSSLQPGRVRSPPGRRQRARPVAPQLLELWTLSPLARHARDMAAAGRLRTPRPLCHRARPELAESQRGHLPGAPGARAVPSAPRAAFRQPQGWRQSAGAARPRERH